MQLKKVFKLSLAWALAGLALPLAAEQATGNPPPAPAAAGEIRLLLVARNETTLASQINASIKQLPHKAGDSFKANELLVDFDCRLPQAQLNRARAELQGADKTLAANLKLKGFQAIGELEVALAEAQVAKAKAEVALASAQVSLCDIRAPFKGRVVELHAAQYAGVSPGEKLMTIIDDSRLEVQTHIPSLWLASVKRGSRFQARIDETGKTYQAEIIRIGAKVDPVSQTIEIAGKILDQDDALLAGMSGGAQFDLTAAGKEMPK
jgi:RND family efflux transporter MFP subunit